MNRCAVVILNYNGADHLRRFLPSVIRHSKGEADVVVADNGSTDNSIEILHNEFAKDIQILQLPENFGFAEGYNVAARLLEPYGYSYYVLLNSDVEVEQGWLTPLIETLDSESDVAAVAPKILSVNNPTHFEYAGASGGFIDYLGYPFCRGRILGTMEQDKGQYDTPREVFWASGAAFCCRADLFATMGGFCKEFFAHMEEIDLCWRMQLAGWRIKVEPRSRVWHLGGGTLSTNSPRKLYLNHRNNLIMLFRCASPLQRLVVAVVRPATDALAAVNYLAKGNVEGFKAVVRAWCDFLAAHSRLNRERKQIRSSAKRESQNIYKGIIVLRYALGQRRFKNMM